MAFKVVKDLSRTKANGAIIEDHRDAEERQTEIIGWMTGTDGKMSGWGMAPGKSRVAVPIVSQDDAQHVGRCMREQGLIYVNQTENIAGVTGRLRRGDHLRICNLRTNYRWA